MNIIKMFMNNVIILLLAVRICEDSDNRGFTVPMQYLSRECGLYKASDLLLGDHVCKRRPMLSSG